MSETTKHLSTFAAWVTAIEKDPHGTRVKVTAEGNGPVAKVVFSVSEVDVPTYNTRVSVAISNPEAATS